MTSKKINQNPIVSAFSPPSEAPLSAALAQPSDDQDGLDFADLLPEALRRDTTFIPADAVSLHSIFLPVRTAAQRRAALPFALEETVGRSLETTHFALCGVGPGGTVLAAALESAVLEAHMTVAPDTPVVPEQMILPPPSPYVEGKAVWRAYRRGDRVLVRVSDGTGFAARADMLSALWVSAGRPPVESVGAALGSDMAWTDRAKDGIPPVETLADVDLRQGLYRPARGFARPLKALAAGVVLAACAHIAIAALDLRAQRAIADDLRAKAGAALALHLPDARADDDPALIQRQLSAQTQPVTGSTFLPMLERVARALAGADTALGFRQLSWSEDTLRLTIEAVDLDALQQTEAQLRAANLEVSSGSATADAGAARAELTVRP